MLPPKTADAAAEGAADVRAEAPGAEGATAPDASEAVKNPPANRLPQSLRQREFRPTTTMPRAGARATAVRATASAATAEDAGTAAADKAGRTARTDNLPARRNPKNKLNRTTGGPMERPCRP